MVEHPEGVRHDLEWDRPLDERVPVASSNLKAFGVLVREVAVIVVGVSVALGADAMYGRRQDGVERERILNSFRADLRLDSVQFSRVGETTRDATNRLLAVVDHPSGDVDPIYLAAALRESFSFPSGLKETSTYREVTATGKISLIEDEGLRESILRYYGRSFSGIPSEIWTAYFADVHGAYERVLRRHLGTGFLEMQECRMQSADYEACLAPIATRIDFAALRSDPGFSEGLVGMALWAGRFAVFIGGQRVLHEDLVDRLDEVIGEL